MRAQRRADRARRRRSARCRRSPRRAVFRAARRSSPPSSTSTRSPAPARGDDLRAEPLPRFPSIVARHLDSRRRSLACCCGSWHYPFGGAANARVDRRVRPLSGQGRAGRPRQPVAPPHFRAPDRTLTDEEAQARPTRSSRRSAHDASARAATLAVQQVRDATVRMLSRSTPSKESHSGESGSNALGRPRADRSARRKSEAARRRRSIGCAPTSARHAGRERAARARARLRRARGWPKRRASSGELSALREERDLDPRRASTRCSQQIERARTSVQWNRSPAASSTSRFTGSGTRSAAGWTRPTSPSWRRMSTRRCGSPPRETPGRRHAEDRRARGAQHRRRVLPRVRRRPRPAGRRSRDRAGELERMLDLALGLDGARPERRRQIAIGSPAAGRLK